eukprot:scaffold74632_cov33-Tisochrysis_lutea.AAC.4
MASTVYVDGAAHAGHPCIWDRGDRGWSSCDLRVVTSATSLVVWYVASYKPLCLCFNVCRSAYLRGSIADAYCRAILISWPLSL